MEIVSQKVMTPNSILKLVEADLTIVETELQGYAKSAVPLVTDISRYVHSGGGKRLRPAVLLLSSKLCGFEGMSAKRLGAVVELIHVATLVHDDIIDNSAVRRGRPSVNAKWDNSITVLMGDWLYMTSFSIALELRDFRILDLLISMTRKMVEGELMQLDQNGRLDVSEEEQLQICLHKTAFLFSGCGRLGAMLGRSGEQWEEALGTYGRCLGMAFQLVDDLLDYTSSEETLGKPVLKDLEEGKLTLPLIYALQRASSSERESVRRAIRKHELGVQQKEQIVELINRSGAMRDVRKLAGEYAAEAKAALSLFPDSVYREALLRLPDLVLNRSN